MENEGVVQEPQATPAQPQEPVDDWKAKVEEAEKKRIAAEKRAEHLQHKAQQAASQIEYYRRQAERGSYVEQNNYEPDNADASNQARIVAEMQRDIEMAEIAYRQEHPDWQEYEEDMRKLVYDESSVHSVLNRYPDGRPNWRQTFRNARERVENRRFREAKQKAAGAKEQAEANKAQLRNAAQVVGDSAQPTPYTIDPNDPRNPDGSKMTSDQMLDAGLVEMDPHDPIRKIGTDKPARR